MPPVVLPEASPVLSVRVEATRRPWTALGRSRRATKGVGEVCHDWAASSACVGLGLSGSGFRVKGCGVKQEPLSKMANQFGPHPTASGTLAAFFLKSSGRSQLTTL